MGKIYLFAVGGPLAGLSVSMTQVEQALRIASLVIGCTTGLVALYFMLRNSKAK